MIHRLSVGSGSTGAARSSIDALLALYAGLAAVPVLRPRRHARSVLIRCGQAELDGRRTQ